MRRVLIILFDIILIISSVDAFSKTFITYISKNDIVVLRLNNLSKNDEKVKISMMAKQKELYSSDLMSIKGEESIYLPLNDMLKTQFSDKDDGLLVKVDLKADNIENIEYQIITMSSKGGILVSKEVDKMPPPIVQRVVPDKVDISGGGLIAIIGSNFDESAIVKVDGVETLRLRESQNRIIAIVPPHKQGKVSVQVENFGQKPFVLANALEYVLPQPVIQSVNPVSSSQEGGVAVEINGMYFDKDMKVFFGNVASTSITYINDTRIVAIAPPHKAGMVGIKVVSPSGGQAVLSNAFKYYGVPYIKSISPNMGPPEGGTLVTLAGENFDEGSIVFVDNNAAQINFVKANTISFYSPPHQSGYANVEVQNPTGLTAFLPNGFLYNSPPKLVEAYAYPNPCLKRARIRVAVDAIDPENQRLNYQWNVVGGIGGSIIGSGNEVIFECPNIEGEATINVVISDEYNAAIKTSISISVR